MYEAMCDQQLCNFGTFHFFLRNEIIYLGHNISFHTEIIKSWEKMNWAPLAEYRCGGLYKV